MALLLRSILLVLLCSFIFSTSIGVEGFRRLSTEEDHELEDQLKLQNKPAVKTVETKYGVIYDCVDFYKQPAFDHPLLKNHTFHFQMRPSSVPKVIKEKELSIANNTTAFHVELNGVGCPFGTVPIKRITKDDLIRAKLHLDRYGSQYSVLTTDNPGTHYAVVQTTSQSNNTYNGGGAAISTYNPSVSSSQYSSARMKIQNGPDSIQFGWMVNPTLYGHNRTHVFAYLNAGQSRCFNIQCPGFVLVNSDYPIDALIDHVSKSGGPTLLMRFLIYRDPANGNWWLEVGQNYTKVGFWPQRIFTGLTNMATNVQWGGEAFSPPDVRSPPMGSGQYVEKGSTLYDAYCDLMTTINDAHEVVDAVNTQLYSDSEYYNVKDEGNVKGAERHLMLYGGPGGATGS